MAAPVNAIDKAGLGPMLLELHKHNNWGAGKLAKWLEGNGLKLNERTVREYVQRRARPETVSQNPDEDDKEVRVIRKDLDLARKALREVINSELSSKDPKTSTIVSAAKGLIEHSTQMLERLGQIRPVSSDITVRFADKDAFAPPIQAVKVDVQVSPPKEISQAPPASSSVEGNGGVTLPEVREAVR